MNCILHCFGIGALSFLQFVLQSFVYLMVMLYHLQRFHAIYFVLSAIHCISLAKYCINRLIFGILEMKTPVQSFAHTEKAC